MVDPSTGVASLKTLPFRWGVTSHTGKVRPQNEDAFAIEPEAGLFLVSDGMGGHQGGELASEIVTQDLPPAIEIAVADLKNKQPHTIRRVLERWIARQSLEIHQEGHSESGYKGMGATLVLALLINARAYIANLGDSRAYRFRNRRLCQFSEDHSVVAELVAKGRITPEQAESHEAQGVITQYAGMDEHAKSHVRSFALRKQDRILLCTDGLTDLVDEKTIAQTLGEIPDCQACCEALVKRANQAGGHDNVTVLILEWT